MNGIYFAEGFDAYAAVSEIVGRFSRLGVPGQEPTLNSTGGKLGRKTICAAGKFGGAGLFFDLPAGLKKVGIHFTYSYASTAAPSSGDYRYLLSAGSLGRRLAYEASLVGSASPNVANAPSDLLTLMQTTAARNFSALNGIQVAASGSASVNALTLPATTYAFPANQPVSVEAVIDVSGATAIVKVWIDGTLIVNTTFARDRVVPLAGVKTDAIEYIALNADSPSRYSDIVVYNPDVLVAPIGPVSVRLVPALDDNFSVNFNDASPEEIGTSFESFPMTDAGSGIVYGAQLVARVRGIADGDFFEPEMKVASGDYEATFSPGQISGQSYRVYTYPTALDTIAEINAATISARAK